jgi:serine/threonine protein kinase
MDSARWQRVKAVFQDAFERERSGQDAVVAAAFPDDPEMREAVQRLLRAHARDSGPLDSPPAVVLDPADFTERDREDDGGSAGTAPTRIGPYRIVRELGRGGMGTVYLAERDEPGMRKTVAVKVVRHGMDSAFVVSRFRTERPTTARPTS